MESERWIRLEGLAAILMLTRVQGFIVVIVDPQVCSEVAFLLELPTAFEAKKPADTRMNGLVILQVMMLHEAFVAASVRAFVSLHRLVCLQVILESLLGVELPVADIASLVDFHVNGFLVFPQVKQAFEAAIADRTLHRVVGVVRLKMRISV